MSPLCFKKIKDIYKFACGVEEVNKIKKPLQGSNPNPKWSLTKPLSLFACWSILSSSTVVNLELFAN